MALRSRHARETALGERVWWLWPRPRLLAAGLALGFAAGGAASVLGFLRVASWWPLRFGWTLHAAAPPPVAWLSPSPGGRQPVDLAAAALDSALWVVAGLALAGLLAGLLHAALANLEESATTVPERALRAAVGATPRQLRRERLAEGTILSGLAVALGIVLGSGIHGMLVHSLPSGLILPATTGGPGRHLGVPAVAVLLMAGLILVAVRALAARGKRLLRRPAPYLAGLAGPRTGGGNGVGSGAGGVDGWLLSAGQVAVAVVVAVAALLLLRASPVPESTAEEYPYATDTLVLRTELPPGGATSVTWERSRTALQRLPRVKVAAVASPGAFLGLGPEDRAVADCPWCTAGGMFSPLRVGRVRFVVVGRGYFRLLAGDRRSDSSVPGGAWVDRRARHAMFQDGDPVGRTLWLPGAAPLRDPGVRIFGVVDAPGPIGLGVRRPIMPAAYLSLYEHPPRVADLAFRVAPPDDPVAEGKRAAQAIVAAAPGARVRVLGRLDRLLAARRAPLRWLAEVTTGLAVLCLILSAVSVIGTLRARVWARAAELGLRRAVGARRRDVVALVLGEARGLLGAGAAVGCVVATALDRGLPLLLSGVDPLPAWTLLAMAGGLGVFGLLAAMAAVRETLGPPAGVMGRA